MQALEKISRDEEFVHLLVGEAQLIADCDDIGVAPVPFVG